MRKFGLEILFSVAIISILACYESVITSQVILPPEPIVFQTNFELIMAGYKIQVQDYGQGLNESSQAKFVQILKEGLKLKTSVDDILQKVPIRQSSTEVLSKSSSAIIIDKYDQLTYLSYMKSTYPNVICWGVPEYALFARQDWIIEKYLHHRFLILMELLRQAGISSMIENGIRYAWNVRPSIVLEKTKFQEQQPQPLALRSGKFIAIFRLTGTLISFSGVVFILELIFKWYRKVITKVYPI